MKGIKLGWLTAGLLGGGLVVVTGIVAARYQKDMRSIQQRIEDQGSRIVETACGPIEVAIQGTGAPLLVIHGNGGGFDHGFMVADGYAGPGFQVIAPSRFGYLRSPVPAGATPAMQADVFACLLDALDIRQTAILATSAGVTSAIQFSLRHPERVSAMALHSPNAPGEVGLVPPPQPVFSALLHSDFAFWALTTYFKSSLYALAGVPKGFALTPQMEADVSKVLTSVLPSSERADGVIFDTYVGNPEINTYPLEQVRTPTLVVSAIDDPEALHSGARTLAERIPSARLLAVPDGGHLMLGHTEEIKLEITQFLNSHVAQLNSRP